MGGNPGGRDGYTGAKRMRKRSFLIMVATAGLLLSARSYAQSPAPAAPAPPEATQKSPRIVKNVNEVTLVLSAVDKHRRFIYGLHQADFRIYDDKQPQQVSRFLDEGNLPLRVALLLDTSTSISDRFKFEQQAAIDFLGTVLKPGRDQALVVAFDTNFQLVQDFTDNEELLAKGIRSLRPGGGTALYDAIYQTASEKLQGGEGDNVRRVMVVISDGNDNWSRVSREEALEMAQRAGAIVYAIGTEPTGLDPDSDSVLRRLADQTGGRAFFPFNAGDLGSKFQDIATELRHQYVLSYRPSNFVPNGTYHSISVQVLRNGILARTRRGYYATVAGATP